MLPHLISYDGTYDIEHRTYAIRCVKKTIAAFPKSQYNQHIRMPQTIFSQRNCGDIIVSRQYPSPQYQSHTCLSPQSSANTTAHTFVTIYSAFIAFNF